MNVTYDPALDAAYISIGREWRPVALTYPVDGDKAGAYIHLDFDNTGRLVGIEALEARRLLSAELLTDSRGAMQAHYDPETDAATIYLHPQLATTGKPFSAYTQHCNQLSSTVASVRSTCTSMQTTGSWPSKSPTPAARCRKSF